MSVSQYEYWKHTHLTVDVVKGRGSGFSVEAPEGVRFLIRSRLLTDEESCTAFGIRAAARRLISHGRGGSHPLPGVRTSTPAYAVRRAARHLTRCPDRASASATKPLALSSSTTSWRKATSRATGRGRADGLADLHERLVDHPHVVPARREGGDGLTDPRPDLEALGDEDVDALAAAHDARALERPREVEVVGRAVLDPDAHPGAVHIRDGPHGGGGGHDVDALDHGVGRGEGDLGGARRVDGEETQVGRPRSHGREGLAGGVEADERGRHSQSARDLARDVDRDAGRRSWAALRENRVAEVDRGSQDARRREVVEDVGRRGAGGHTGRVGQRTEGLARCPRWENSVPMSRRIHTWSVAAVASLAIAGVTLPAQGATAPFDHTATGTVFLPNPVQQLGNETLTDHKDADYAGLRRRRTAGSRSPTSTAPAR